MVIENEIANLEKVGIRLLEDTKSIREDTDKKLVNKLNNSIELL